MVASQLDSNGHERLEQRRRYRLGYYGAVVGAVVSLFLVTEFGYPLVGIGLYLVGVLVTFAILWRMPVEFFDERERAMRRRAAEIVINLLAVAGIVAIPGALVLDGAGHLTITPLMEGVGLGFVALYVLLMLAYGVLWLRE